MACNTGNIALGFKSTLFPTIYFDEKFVSDFLLSFCLLFRCGKMKGINVEILKALARLENCQGLQFTEFSSSGKLIYHKVKLVQSRFRKFLHGRAVRQCALTGCVEWIHFRRYRLASTDGEKIRFGTAEQHIAEL